MNYLLDTHIIIWLLEGNERLSRDVLEMLTDKSNCVYYSTASIWEVTIKKMTHPSEINIIGSKLSELCKASGMKMLPMIQRWKNITSCISFFPSLFHYTYLHIAQQHSLSLVLIQPQAHPDKQY